MAVLDISSVIIESMSGKLKGAMIIREPGRAAKFPARIAKWKLFQHRVRKVPPQNVPLKKAWFPDPRREKWDHRRHPACMAYYGADWLWTAGHVDIDLWRKAVKKPKMSAYALWIHEATRCARNGEYYPDVPSISGGWSLDHVVPGFRFQPPADCVHALQVSSKRTFILWNISPEGGYQIAFLAEIYDILDAAPGPTYSIEIRWHWNPFNGFPTVHNFGPFPNTVYNPIYPFPARQDLRLIIKCEPGWILSYQATYYTGNLGLEAVLYDVSQEAHGDHQNLAPWK